MKKLKTFSLARIVSNSFKEKKRRFEKNAPENFDLLYESIKKSHISAKNFLLRDQPINKINIFVNFTSKANDFCPWLILEKLKLV